MALPVNFGGLSGGNQPLSLFDTQSAALGALGNIPCAASGQNTIALTPLTNTPTISSYTDLSPTFVYVAAQTSNAAVLINAAGLGARNAYKWNGFQAMGANDSIANGIYKATFLTALNGGAGGFVVDAIDTIALTNFDIEYVIDGGGSAITAGNKGAVHIPFVGSIFAWRMIADQSGSITVDILRANSGIPSASMVGAGTKPNLSAGQLNAGTVPSGWTSTALAVDDWVAFNVTALATSITRVTVVLSGSKQ